LSIPNSPNSPTSKETHWEKAAKTKMGKYLTRVETSFILKEIDTSKLNLVIDVGAEAGRFSLLTANANVSVIGIDIDSYSLRRLKQKNDGIPVIQADARKIPLKDGTFDAVLMIEVLDYIPQTNEALTECNRILKPKSSLILSFGNQSSAKAKLRQLKGKTYMHSYDQVIRTLRDSGFAVFSKTGYNWIPLGRISESPLIPFLAGLEKIFGLRKIPSLSPWVIVHAKKSS
jgi:ubiquinone/menaquinone biosynthesis C-methylase UbiE